MQKEPFRGNRQNPRYEWVPKSRIASSSSAKSPAPAPPPPPPGNGKGKRHNRRSSRKGRRRPASRRRGERRNWAEMPFDALSVIFEKLGPIELLFSAQAVCRSWRHLALEKDTWRKVDFRIGMWDFYDRDVDLPKMSLAAIDRSCGLLEEFSIEYFGDDKILDYMAERSPKLKCLRFVSCYAISSESLVEALKKLPLLEEIYITFHSLDTSEVLPIIGELCPSLRSFHLNVKGVKCSDIRGFEDIEAMGIAKSMPMLQELQLFGNHLTNKGLGAILDACPDLKSLDLRQCFNIKMDDALKRRCAKIENLRLPYDSTADYPFDSTFTDLTRDFASFDIDEFVSDYEDYGVYGYEDEFDDFASLGYEDYVAYGGNDAFDDFSNYLYLAHGDNLESPLHTLATMAMYASD